MKPIAKLSLIITLIYGCNEEIVPNETPECIDGIVTEILDGPVSNPPGKIYSYTYMGEVVYFIPQRCCDIRSEVYDKNCNYICAPNGGITGNGDGKCPDFFLTATKEKLIWEDLRK